MRKIIEITMELAEIKNDYNTDWTVDEIESFVEYIIDAQRNDEYYTVDQWLEETEQNYPELLGKKNYNIKLYQQCITFIFFF